MSYVIFLICVLFFVLIYLAIRKKYKSKTEANETYILVLQLIAAIFTIVGVTSISIFGPIINLMPYKQIKDAESAIQQIGLRQSKEYIESIVGPAKSYMNIDLPMVNGSLGQGRKSIYDNRYYLLICYYRDDNSLLGYFLVSKDKNFNPKRKNETMIHIFGSKNMFYEPINSTFHYGEKTRSFIVMVGYRLNPMRPDGSGYYMEYHHHLMSTRNIYMGVGKSEFGYNENYDYFWKHYQDLKVGKYISLYEYRQYNPFQFISDINDISNVVYNDISLEGDEPTLEYIKSEDVDTKYNLLPHGKVNTISMFENDYEINVVKLLTEELDGKISLTRMEYDYLY